MSSRSIPPAPAGAARRASTTRNTAGHTDRIGTGHDEIGLRQDARKSHRANHCRYKLLEKVGEGGCAVVYVAEQIEPVRQGVALFAVHPQLEAVAK